MTPQRKAELWAKLEDIIGPMPKHVRPAPKLVCINGRVIAGAVVIVSPSDPNWWRAKALIARYTNGEIHVRPDWRRV